MRRYFGFLWSLRRFFDVFNDEWDTTPECALALWRFLTIEKYQDHQRTTAYYEDIVRFVRDWQHPMETNP